MTKDILIISGSPQKKGNTATLIEWFREGALGKGAPVEIIHAAFLKYKAPGCTSCRLCQKSAAYVCVLDDEVSPILAKMAKADVVVMATPMYFFAPSAQLKIIFDRMFSLYKWDNAAGTMQTVLKGKTMVLIASAYEDLGLDALARPFELTADYSGMKFEKLLVPNAGVSGDVKNKPGTREQAVALGEKVAQGH